MPSPRARPFRRSPLGFASVAVTILAFPVLMGGFARQDPGDRLGSRVLAQVLERVQRYGVDSVTTEELYERAARGLVSQLGDPYAELFSPAELASFSREEIGNDYGGLGVQIEDQRGVVTVTQVFPHSPAERGGVQAGDRIVQVDTAPARGKSLEEVSRLLLGPEGTPVTVTFARAGIEAPITTRFTRAQVHVPAVPYAIVLDGGVGYVPLQRFNATAAAEVAAAVSRLSRQGARAFIIDVRGNTGGDMEQSLAISELFLQAGQELASLRSRGPDSVSRFVARRAPLVPDAPLVVLTDGGSASASEIVAGSLQDHDRALVVGTPSYGKGLVQSLYPLEGGWALKVTTAKWYTPSGRSIQRERGPDGAPLPMADSARPAFRSTGGRVVHGGGGIAPDLLVRQDTLTTAEQEFMKALAPKSAESYVALYDLARELRREVGAPDFVVTQAWRDEFRRRLERAGVQLAPGQVEAAGSVVDRMLEHRIASLAFGDSTAFRRGVRHDAPLQRSLELLREAESQQALLAAIPASPIKQTD